jgi:3-methylfumaryl-CoA hydratase
VSVALRIEDLRVGDELPSRAHTPTSVSLFVYNAAVWNAHRIHYDEPYTMQVEKHPGIVVDGPLQGDWLAQCVTNWLGDGGVLERFAYSNRRACYLGETLTSGGRIAAVNPGERTATLELWVKNERGEVTSPGSATVRLTA